MTSRSGRFLRDNAFIVAAISLPLVVVAFFLLSSIIPRWLVAPPTHDLLIRVDVGYNNPTLPVAMDFNVRDGTVEATVRPLDALSYFRPALLLVDHTSMTAREIPVDVPAAMATNEQPHTLIVEALAGRRVLAGPRAPDGYHLEHRSQRGPLFVGDVFGMNGRYDHGATLVNRGRVVPITLPPRYQYPSSVQVVGWLVPGQDEGQR